MAFVTDCLFQQKLPNCVINLLSVRRPACEDSCVLAHGCRWARQDPASRITFSGEFTLRFKLYATVGACLAVAAFTLPGLADAGSAAAATSASASTVGQLPVSTALPSPTRPRQPSGAKDCATSTSPLMMQCQSIVATSAKAKAAAKDAAQAAVSARAKGESPKATVSSSGPLTPADL